MQSLSSGLRLQTLLFERLPEIVGREVGNEDRINLYCTGDYWAAFERSAYQLCRLYPDCEVYPVYLDTCPSPVVMASLPYAELRDCSDAGCPECGGGFVEISAQRLKCVEYERWYRKEIEGYEG